MQGAGADGWSPRQRALLLGTDELHELHVISDATWELLAEELGDQQLLELCFVVGHYEMLAMVLNSLGVEPEPTTLDRLETLTPPQPPAPSAKPLRRAVNDSRSRT